MAPIDKPADGSTGWGDEVRAVIDRVNAHDANPILNADVSGAQPGQVLAVAHVTGGVADEFELVEVDDATIADIAGLQSALDGKSPGDPIPAGGEYIFDRRMITTAAVAPSTSGTLRLTYFRAAVTETIGKIKLISGGTAAGATPTLARVGVYSEAANGDLTLVAAIASDTTLAASAGASYTRNLTAPWSKVRGQRYAVGVLFVTSAAMPTFPGIPGQAAGGLIGAEMATTPRWTASLAAQTDLPASIPAGSLASSGIGMIFTGLLP